MQDTSNLADMIKEMMEELIQTRSLGQFPLAFYQDCEEVADRIQAFVPQTRALLWVAVGLAAQLPSRAEQILTQAQKLTAVLPAGSLQTQLLTETLICQGLCSPHCRTEALWDPLTNQIRGTADQDARLRLSLCLVGSLAMAAKYSEAVTEMCQIPSAALQASALKAIAQVLRGAGGR